MIGIGRAGDWTGEAFTIGSSGFGSSKVNEEDSLYKFIEDQSDPKLWSIAKFIGQVSLPECLYSPFLFVNLHGTVPNATVLGLTWPSYHLLIIN